MIAKLILFSILFFSFALPMRAARDRHPVRGLKKAVAWTVGFNVLYLLAVLYVWPRLGG